jgi:hypothetical protein
MAEAATMLAATQQQILQDAAGCAGEAGPGGLHPPLEPCPDIDWVGETWGLFWPDIEGEMDEKKEDPSKYLKKHYPDPKAAKEHPPATEKASVCEPPAPLTCPEAAAPAPRPATPPRPVAPPVARPAAPPPPVKLRPKKEPQAPVPRLKSPPRIEVFEGPKDIDNDNSKWGWMRSEDSSASKARFRLSIFW